MMSQNGLRCMCYFLCVCLLFSVCLSVCLFVCLSVCLFVCLSVCLSVCLFVCVLCVHGCGWVRACIRKVCYMSYHIRKYIVFEIVFGVCSGTWRKHCVVWAATPLHPHRTYTYAQIYKHMYAYVCIFICITDVFLKWQAITKQNACNCIASRYDQKSSGNQVCVHSKMRGQRQCKRKRFDSLFRPLLAMQGRIMNLRAPLRVRLSKSRRRKL